MPDDRQPYESRLALLHSERDWSYIVYRLIADGKHGLAIRVGQTVASLMKEGHREPLLIFNPADGRLVMGTLALIFFDVPDRIVEMRKRAAEHLLDCSKCSAEVK